MNDSVRLFLLALLGCLGVSCASTVQSRIEKYPEKFASQPESHKQLITQGRIKEGMNKDAVYLAWGAPASVRQGSENGRDFELWRYMGHYPVYTDNVVMGYYPGYRHGDHYHRGGYNVDVVPTVNYVPYNRAEVEFSGGKVKKWDRQR